MSRRRMSAIACWFGHSGLAGLLLAAFTAPAAALTPDSPEVLAIANKAKAHLTQKHAGYQTGPRALAGYAMLKAGADANDPVVQSALKACYEDNLTNTRMSYETSIYLLFLVTLDLEGNRARIEELHRTLLAIQKPFGAWGYSNLNTGDTSMTQYAVLCLWELEHKGVRSPDDAWGRVCNWFLRTQDPSGYWQYQGMDPGGTTLVKQGTIPPTHSMAAGGAGSVYIMMDHFQVGRSERAKEKSDDVPDALKLVGSKKEKKHSSAAAAGVDVSRLQAAAHLADDWHEANFKIETKHFNNYYLYAYERYQAFKAIAEGRPIDDESAWYDEGVEFLRGTQTADGSWTGNILSPLEQASFGLLFLMRPAKKILADRQKGLGGGSLIGGHGLPKNADELQERAGRLAPKPLRGPADAMLKIIEDPENPDHSRAAEGLGEFVMEADEATLSKLAGQLRKLAAGKSPEARAVALRALARTRNLDDVPLLIASLNDPTEIVAQEAHGGLRFLSRKFTSVGPDVPEPGPERRLAMERWKAWFRTIRPNAEFLE